MTQSKKVNCFLVGGPKCGTTAMVAHLKTHNGIFVSEPKECNYFLEDMPEMKYVTNLKEYHSLFGQFNLNNKYSYEVISRMPICFCKQSKKYGNPFRSLAQHC